MRFHAKASSAGSNSGLDPSPRAPRRRPTAPAFVLVFLAFACLLPSSAGAADHPFLETFGSANQPNFGEAAGMAVDPANGDLLVIDYENQTLSRFNPNGTAANFSALTSTNVIDGHAGEADEVTSGAKEILSNEGFSSTEVQIAVAPPGAGGGTAGNIYATDAENGRVVVFSSTGAYLTQISGGFPCGVAVAPNGNVFVGDFTTEKVLKFVPSVNGSPPPPSTYTKTGEFSAPEPCQVAATEGFVFVAQFENVVRKIDSEGAEEGTTKYTVASGANLALNVDPSSGHLFAVAGSALKEYDASGALSATEVSTTSLASGARGVAIAESSGNVYVSRAGNANVEVRGPLAEPPTATTNPATAIGHTVATLHGHLDPGGDSSITDCYFDWGTTSGYGNTADCSQGDSFSTAADVSADLGGLAPGATYHFRLHVTGATSGDVTGADQSLTATAFPVSTEPATAVHHTSAVLNGHLDPEGDPALNVTDCYFDWGTTSGYGNTADCSQGDSFSTAADVSADLGGLAPGTTYHFRLHVTTASAGQFTGGDRAFTSPLFPSAAEEVAAFGPDGTEATSFGANSPNQLAFNQADRSLFAIDKSSPGIRGFDASGPPAYSPLVGFTPLATPATGPEPDLAIDNTALSSAGNLYFVSEGFEGGTGKVYGFDSTGAPLGGNFPISDFDDPCGLAIDSTGAIWVGDYGAKAVKKYDSAGNPLGSVNVQSGVSGPCHLAFNSADDLYVAMYLGDVWRYGAASGYASASATKIDDGDAMAIAVNPSTDHLFVAHPTKISRYDANGSLFAEFATGIAGADFIGVTVDAASGYVYVSDRGNHKIRVLAPTAPTTPPTLTPGSPTAITGASATLHAKVDPEGIEVTDCHFDYGPTATYGQSAPCSPDPGSGSGDVDVSTALSDLSGGTTYHFRIVASNATPGGTATGPDQTFTTLGPVIDAQSVEGVSFSDAAVSARINPKGEPATYHVEYGPTVAYGQSTPETLPLGFAGDESFHAVSVHIGGLSAGTTYHFRFVATNAAGVDRALDATLTTYPPPPAFGPCHNDSFRGGFSGRLPDCRAYEQATPTDKHGANAQGKQNTVQASSSGDRVTFYTTGGLPTSGGSSTLSTFLASRGPGGWSSDGLIPPTDPNERATVLGWSEDLSTTAVTAPGPSHVGEGLYLRDSGSGAFELGPTLPDGIAPNERIQVGAVAAFAADTSHLIFESKAVLAPGAIAASGTLDARQNLYDLDHGTVSLVDRIPAGAATSCDDESGPACVPAPDGAFAGPYDWEGSSTDHGGVHSAYYTQNTISRDGSKAFFTVPDSAQIYVREDGTATTQVSASQRGTPDPNGQKPAAFMAAIPDGSEVFFTSCEKLTDDSTAVSTAANSCTTASQGQDLYSYDTGSGELTDLTVDPNASDPKGAAVRGVLGTSEDGSYVYFAANGVLAPGASPGNCADSSGTCNLYLAHEGSIAFIATLSGGDRLDWAPYTGCPCGQAQALQKYSRVSADGRVLVFASQRSLTGYDNKGPCFGGSCRELFRYTAPDEGLACLSCNPTAARPSREVTFGANRGNFFGKSPSATFLTRNLSADGSRAFFESADALLPIDTNGVTDVYEWEAQGSGSCRSEGGCIYLISTGTGTSPAQFADASVDGDHVFFFTDQALVPSDRDQFEDVYDAAVGGGLPSQHPLAPPTCNSTACQANPAPPPQQTPASASFQGAGNAHEPAARRRCPKGRREVRHAGKVRCQKAHRQHRRHHNRGGSK